MVYVNGIVATCSIYVYPNHVFQDTTRCCLQCNAIVSLVQSMGLSVQNVIDITIIVPNFLLKLQIQLRQDKPQIIH